MWFVQAAGPVINVILEGLDILDSLVGLAEVASRLAGVPRVQERSEPWPRRSWWLPERTAGRR